MEKILPIEKLIAEKFVNLESFWRIDLIFHTFVSNSRVITSIQCDSFKPDP